METINNFNSILNSFKISAQCVDYQKVDNYFYYDVRLYGNGKVKDIHNISDELALALKATSKPSIKAIHEKGVIRVEFASPRQNIINFNDCLKDLDSMSDLTCFLGKQSNGQDLYMDLSQNPHLLIAGTTGSGKSTLLHTIIASLLYHNTSDIFLIDPKNSEFFIYDSKFDNVNVFYDYESALSILDGLIDIMESRYQMIKKGIKPSSFNHIVAIIDEFSDLVLQDEGNIFQKTLCKLAQKCRAAKIHLVLSTQRPSANVINGVIKANFPARISCKVSSHIDSKIILDSVGAENLIGKGDALIKDSLRNLERFQTAYISPEEIIQQFGK